MTEISVQPFVKWVGSKRQLPEQMKARLPEHSNGYIEPFVDGGAAYPDLQLERSIINDMNEPLINAYSRIEISPEEFADAIPEYDKKIADGGKKYYYRVRENYNDRMMQVEYGMELAVLSVFLSRHCFDGLYRVNGRGLSNILYNNGMKESCNKESIMTVS